LNTTFIVIGSPNVEYLKAMEAEHCAKAGCDLEFTTLHKKTTTPKAEWSLVIAKRNMDAEMHSKRRIPDIDLLEQSDLVQQAKLSRFEIMAVILYTGPMVSSSVLPFTCHVLSRP
jgi:hypothetical protein